MLRFTLLAGILWLLGIPACAPPGTSRQPGVDPELTAYRWAEISLAATAWDTERFKPRPTVTSRCLALTWGAVYDAWSRYDHVAGTIWLAGVDRVGVKHRTAESKAEAISYAAYHALRHYYFADSVWLAGQMRSLGYDPDRQPRHPQEPAAIGIAAARAVIAARMDDGANEAGQDLRAPGDRYGDYTGYLPVNSADTLEDLAHWQPKYFVMKDGTRTAPGCLTPQWSLVKPITLSRADLFRAPPPPKPGTAELREQVAQVVTLQAGLTPQRKALVEFMRDGPASVQQAGHWLRFAMDVSERDHNDLDRDVNLFLVTTVTAMDAFIACWDSKMYYDFARPYALVHAQFGEDTITGWGGPDKGMVRMKGIEWRPYSPDAFLCPPFPAYVSGHSTVSGACGEILRLFTGSDTFGIEVRWAPGSMTEPAFVTDSVTLAFPTFTATADSAGWSRVLGGYHIQADNLEGLALGRKLGQYVWDWYQALRSGASRK